MSPRTRSSRRNKTTGHLVVIALAALAWLLAAPQAPGTEITLTTSNDPVSGNRRADDLYTAEVALGVHWLAHHVELRERMFTDHQRGLRFDETSLAVSRPGLRLGGWTGEAGLGVLHVGRGLLGESVQNAVHDLVGSEREDLRYAADHRLYPLARLELERPLAEHPAAGSLTGRVEAVAAPGFHSSLRAGVVTEHRFPRGFGLTAGIAGVLHDAESSLLGDVVEASGLAWDLGVEWRRLFVRYSHNAYGTDSRHLTLGYRVAAEAVERWLAR